MSTPSSPSGPAAFTATPPAPAPHAAPVRGDGWTGPVAVSPFAHWGARVGAYLLDNVIISAPTLVGYGVALATAEVVRDPFTGAATPEPTTAGVLAILLGLLAQLALWVWNRGIRQGRTGQSLGKSAAGIRLVREQGGAPLGTGTALLRDFAHIADAPLYLGYLWPLWDGRRQTFADKIVSTVVVKG
jgi:uncharacterized RDD family membrane protein YckC